MTPLLKTLNDICYVLECAALDYLGEGRSELGLLCDRLETDPSYAIPDHNQVALELRGVLADYKNGDKLKGSSRLGRVSRSLWALLGG